MLIHDLTSLKPDFHLRAFLVAGEIFVSENKKKNKSNPKILHLTHGIVVSDVIYPNMC